MTKTEFHPLSWPPSGRGAIAEERREGLREGRSVCLFTTGSMAWEGYFQHDEPIGRWRFFSEDGALLCERFFAKRSVRVPTFLQGAVCAAS